MPRQKLSHVQKLLNQVRRDPSPTCHDPRQLELEDAVKIAAFAELDAEIKRHSAEQNSNDELELKSPHVGA